MKICSKCGAINSDNKFFCIDCNEKLHDSLSKNAAEKVENELSANIDNISNRNDPLFVSLTDRILGLVSVICALLSLAVLIIGFVNRRNLSFLWLALLFSVISSIEAFLPRITWCIEKIRLSFTISNPDDAEPGLFYKLCRKFSIILLTSLGIVLLLTSIISLKNPPVVKYISEIASDKTVATSSFSRDYIDANKDKWQEIISSGDYAVSEFLDELKKAEHTGLEEVLMMEAINEIKGSDLNTSLGKDKFLLDYSYFVN